MAESGESRTARCDLTRKIPCDNIIILILQSKVFEKDLFLDHLIAKNCQIAGLILSTMQFHEIFFTLNQ